MMTINRQQGMGLLEALLAVGIVGGLALVINQFSQNATKVVNNLEMNEDIKVTVQQIQAVLSDTESCTTTFTGKNASNAPNVVEALKKKNATGYADAFKTITVSPTVNYGQKTLKINSYSLSDASPEVDVATLGTTQLLINFNRGKKGIQAESLNKKVNLRVVVNGAGNITSCVAFDAVTSDIWKLAANNSDIYFDSGNVAVNVNAPTANLTVRATTFPYQPGIAILGNENAAAGWNRAAITFTDSSASADTWRVALFGSSSVEGSGKFGINYNGQPQFTLTKKGNLGIGTTRPNCEVTSCENNDEEKLVHIHSSGTGIAEGGSVFLSSNAIGVNKIVGSIAFGTLARTANDKRVATITGHTTSAAGAPLSGSLLFWTNNNGASNWNMVLNDVGNLWVRGEVGVHAVTERSDQRLKKDIIPLTNSLEKVMNLQGVNYSWKNPELKGNQMGFVAQDVEKIFPEAVTETSYGYKAVGYSSLLTAAIDAFKELYSNFSSLDRQITNLKQQNLELKKILCKKDPEAPFCEVRP